MITNDVENYPGYPEGVMGPKMMEDFRLQAARFGTDIRYTLISEVKLDQTPKWVKTDDGKELTADAIIIATGASAKWLGIESEQRLNGFGVSACAVCDGYFFRQQEVAIVGAGDTAAEEATYLSKLCSKVHMIVRRDEMRASKVMQERVFNTPNIQIYWNSETDEILGDTAVTGVRIKNTQTGEKTEIPITGFFVAIGHKPNTDIFKGQLIMDETGYIHTEGKSTRTNLFGVFACGDAQDHVYRQAVTAAGTGCMAALDAERWLVENKLA